MAYAAGVVLQTLVTVTAATTGATATQLSSQLCAQIYLECDDGNTGKIYVGDSNVSASRYMTCLTIQTSGGAAGTYNRAITISAPWGEKPTASQLQMSSIYVIASTSGQKLHVSFLERLG